MPANKRCAVGRNVSECTDSRHAGHLLTFTILMHLDAIYPAHPIYLYGLPPQPGSLPRKSSWARSRARVPLEPLIEAHINIQRTLVNFLYFYRSLHTSRMPAPDITYRQIDRDARPALGHV
jgi:hypothetical protein